MTESEEKYKDIINKSWRSEAENLRPGFFRKHPRMTLENRAKVFAPFAALRGHGDRLTQEIGKQLRSRRPELSEEEAGALSDKLLQVRKGMEITVTCFIPDTAGGDTGRCVSLTGTVEGLDPVYRIIKINTGEESLKGELTKAVKFDDLLDITGKDITDIAEFLGEDFSDI